MRFELGEFSIYLIFLPFMVVYAFVLSVLTYFILSVLQRR